jgi:CRISPR-associated protein Csx17
VCRVADPDALAHWEAGRLVLTTHLDAAELVDALRDKFTPLAIVSPWNAGSGFAANGKSVEAERALDRVRTATDPRFSGLRSAVLVADKVVAEGRRRGWGGSKDEMWDKGHKPDVVQLSRDRLPDDAVPWIDAAVVVDQDRDPTYSRLLGTGGNFGRQDLSATYVQQALMLFLDQLVGRSESWLQAALFADESVPYLRGAVGQFDPVRAGGIQTSILEKGDGNGFVNPWSTMLTFEGTLLFASAVVRRHGAQTSRVAVPFQVRASTVGFPSSASEENVLGEIWTPEWSRPARLVELEQLLGEGRADWHGGPAQNGLDFVRAVSSLGVDRGLTHFTRHVFGERLGQSPLAVPIGRVVVRRQGRVGLLAQVDPWLDRVGQLRNAPAAIDIGRRQVDEALFSVARGSPNALHDVIVSLGRLHEAVSRSGAARGQVQPLVIRDAAQWWQALGEDSAEIRVAAGLASGRDTDQPPASRGAGPMRLLVTPVEPGPHGPRWTDRPPVVPWAADVVGTVALAHRRRALPGAVADPQDDPSQPQPAVRGVLSAFAHGLVAPVADVVDLISGRLDDERFGDYLRGLLLLDWASARISSDSQAATRRALVVPPALAALLPFFSVLALPLRLREDEAGPQPVVLRPGSDWLPSLLAAGPAAVLLDAVRRLRAAGLDTVPAEALERTEIRGDRLAAGLLLRVPRSSRIRALSQVSALPREVSGLGTGRPPSAGSDEQEGADE